MPNLTNKKTKTINSISLIKNQITNILQPVNGTIAIKQPTNTILTQNAVSQNYYIPLLETINGEQSINVKAPLSFNATTNTLSVPNLTISNLPTCNVDASNSSDLVRKSYANTYAYFDLSGGDRWYCEDWITGTIKGKYNWDISGSISMMSTTSTIFNGTATTSNHIGIIALNHDGQFGTDGRYLQFALPISYSARNMKSIRFIAYLSGPGSAFIGFKESLTAKWTGSDFDCRSIYWRLNTGGSNGISYGINNERYTTQQAGPVGNWFLLEISIDKNGYVSFYMTRLTENGERVKNPPTPAPDNITPVNFTPVNFTGYIFVGAIPYSNASRYTCIDYIDWVVSS
jgi:hypothetical protein